MANSREIHITNIRLETQVGYVTRIFITQNGRVTKCNTSTVVRKEDTNFVSKNRLGMTTTLCSET